jgi:hypothetical protein
MCDQIVNLVAQVKSNTICDGHSAAVAGPAGCADDDRRGLPEYQVSAWNAICAPKNTPPAVAAKLNGALVKALDDGNRARTCSNSVGTFQPNLPAARRLFRILS